MLKPRLRLKNTHPVAQIITATLVHPVIRTHHALLFTVILAHITVIHAHMEVSLASPAVHVVNQIHAMRHHRAASLVVITPPHATNQIHARHTTKILAHHTTKILAHHTAKILAHHTAMILAHHTAKIHAHRTAQIPAHHTTKIHALHTAQIPAHLTAQTLALTIVLILAHHTAQTLALTIAQILARVNAIMNHHHAHHLHHHAHHHPQIDAAEITKSLPTDLRLSSRPRNFGLKPTSSSEQSRTRTSVDSLKLLSASRIVTILADAVNQCVSQYAKKAERKMVSREEEVERNLAIDSVIINN